MQEQRPRHVLMCSIERPKTVAVLHAGALGDCVLALHLVQALKRAWNLRGVTMVARSPIARWAQRHGLLAEALSFEQVRAHHWCAERGALPAECTDFLRRFDLIVSLLGGPDEAVARRLAESGTPVLAIAPQPTEETLRRGRHIVWQWADALADPEAPPKAPSPCPLPQRERGILERTFSRGVEVDDAFSLSIDKDRRAEFRRRLAEGVGAGAGSVILCHPGSGGRQKCCAIEAMEALVLERRARGCALAWMIGPDEMERDGAPMITRLEASAPVLCGESVELAADLVAGAEAFIGNDAGMTHVAALAGIRTVALFGPTDPAVWRPLGRECHVVSFPNPDESLECWTAKIIAALG